MAASRSQLLIRAEVVVLIVLTVVPLHALLMTAMPCQPQALDFLVLNTSVKSEQSKPVPKDRNTYFLPGHSLRMLCTYVVKDGKDYCAERNAANLTVYPAEHGSQKDKAKIQESIVIVERNRCNITIEIINVTTDFQGPYRCAEIHDPSVCEQRDFEIGDAPVSPSNISLVYEPMNSISAFLDPVKTGSDLNAPYTTWKVASAWDSDQPLKCFKKESDQMCKDLDSQGLCKPCVIKMKTYSGCGLYRSQGQIALSLKFIVNPFNMFGTARQQSPLLLKVTQWVKPGPVAEIKVRRRRPSALELKVFGPENIDQTHFTLMKTSTGFSLQYTVNLLPADKQSLMLEDNKRFHSMYGLIRNLQDDEEALRASLASSNFPYTSELIQWKSSKSPCSKRLSQASLQIANLPFSGYHYNVSVITKARYWGEPVMLNPTLAITKETAPKEGPGLHKNFFYCLPSRENVCATCLIYFKEIPMTKRGCVVRNYTLSLNLSGEIVNNTGLRCPNTTSIDLSPGGANQTFLVKDLAVGGVYTVHLQANTHAGPSPVTTGKLTVYPVPPSFAPTDVVVEKSEHSFDMSWKSADSAITRYAHYCYTILLEVQGQRNTSSNGTTAAPLPLNCVTNMVSRVLSDNSPSSYIFDDMKNPVGLTPAFFLSTVGPNGDSSGLQSVDCFYSRNKYPRTVDQINVQPAKDDSTALVVKFSVDCGRDLSNRDGRPGRYAVGVVTDDGSCEQNCNEVMMNSKFYTSRIQGSLREQVVHTLTGLQPQTSYCVGVNVNGFVDGFRPHSWSCVTADTAKSRSDQSSYRVFYVVAPIVGTVVVILMVIIYKVRKHVQKLQKKFGSSGVMKDGNWLGRFRAKPIDVVQGVENPSFTSDNAVLLGQPEDQEFVNHQTNSWSTRYSETEISFQEGRLDSQSSLQSSTDSECDAEDSDQSESCSTSTSMVTSATPPCAEGVDRYSTGVQGPSSASELEATTVSRYHLSSASQHEATTVSRYHSSSASLQQATAVSRYQQQNMDHTVIKEDDRECEQVLSEDGEDQEEAVESGEESGEEKDDDAVGSGAVDVESGHQEASLHPTETGTVSGAFPSQQSDAADELSPADIDVILSAAAKPPNHVCQPDSLSCLPVIPPSDDLPPVTVQPQQIQKVLSSPEDPFIDRILQAWKKSDVGRTCQDKEVRTVESVNDIHGIGTSRPQAETLKKHKVKGEVIPQTALGNNRNLITDALKTSVPHEHKHVALPSISQVQNFREAGSPDMVDRGTKNSLAQENGKVNEDPLWVDNILNAARGCVWKPSESISSCDSQDSGAPSHRLHSISKQDSVHVFSGQESGFDTDIDSKSFTGSMETIPLEDRAIGFDATKQRLNI